MYKDIIVKVDAN